MKNRQEHIDKLVDDDIYAIFQSILTNDTHAFGITLLGQILRDGNKGYNKWTDKEIEHEYKLRGFTEEDLYILDYNRITLNKERKVRKDGSKG